MKQACTFFFFYSTQALNTMARPHTRQKALDCRVMNLSKQRTRSRKGGWVAVAAALVEVRGGHSRTQ